MYRINEEMYSFIHSKRENFFLYRNSFENSSEADSVNILEPSNLSLQKDIHSISSLLKLYCRELPDPLCTSKLYGRFLRAAKVPEEYRLGALRAVLLQLPEEHHRLVAVVDIRTL